MSFWKLIKSFLHRVKPRDIAGITAADKLVLFVKNLVSNKDLIIDEIKKYESTKNLPPEERELSQLKIYFTLEEFIVRNKPPTVIKEFTKAELRAEIKNNINIEELDEKIRLIFLPEIEQSISLFKIVLARLKDQFIRSLGLVRFQNIATEAVKGTLLVLNTNGKEIDFVVSSQDKQEITLVALTTAFKKLYSALYEEMNKALGNQAAATVFEKVFTLLKKYYDYELVSRLMDVIPQGVLEDVKLGILSRQELERIVEERTKESEEARSQLEKIVEELKRINKLMVDRELKMIELKKEITLLKKNHI